MTGIAGFDFEYKNRVALNWNAQPLNMATGYGVSIVRRQATGPVWRCIGVFHLTAAENRGRHNVFVEVLDEQGKRTNDPTVHWTWWIDAPIQVRHLDKPANEPAADIPLSKDSTVTLRIDGGIPSDSVGGLHSRHADEGDGNSWGHHSYYIIFQRQHVTITTDTEPQRPAEPPSVEQRLLALEAEVKSLRAAVTMLEQ